MKELQFLSKVLRYFSGLWRKKLFMRFFIVFNTVIIASTILSNSIATRYITKYVEEKHKTHNETILRNTMYYIDESFKKLQKDIILFSADNDFKELMYNDGTSSSKMSSYARYTNKIRKLDKSHSMVDDIVVYYTASGIYINGNGLADIDDYKLDKDFCWNDLLSDESDFTVKKAVYSSALDESSNNVLAVITTFPLFQKPKAAVIVFIKENYIKELMNSFNYSELKKNQYIIMENNTEIISSTGKRNNIEKSHLSNIEKIINTEHDGSFCYELDEEMFITYKTSGFSGWNYINLIPNRQILQQTIYIKRIIISICVIFILLSFIISVWLSSSLYRPISALVDYLESLEDSEADGKRLGKNELVFLQNRFQKIYDINRKLRKSLNNGLPFLLENLLYKILKGNIESRDAIAAELNNLNVELTERYYLVVTIRMDFVEKNKGRYFPSDYINICSKLKKIMYTILRADYNCYPVEIDVYTIAFIFNIKDPDVPENCSYLKEYFDIERFNVRLTIGIGQNYDSIGKIKESFNESLKAINARKVNDRNELIIYSEKLVTKLQSTINDSEKLMSISNCLMSSQYDKSYETSITLVDLCRIKVNTYDCIVSTVNRLISTYKSAVGFMGYSFDELGLDENKLLEDSKNFIYYKEYNELIKRILTKLKYIKKKKEFCENRINIVNYMIEFIKKNYGNNDICLDLIADELKLSSNYLSHFFKKTTGLSFTDYIGMIRVNRAKDLLKKSGLSIREISSQVGFTNINSFNRTFKRYEYITPGRFRKIAKEV